MMRFGWVASLVVLPCLYGGPITAQENPQGGGDLINLFCDGCFDFDFMRREILFVNWVRDREVSDVHVLVTSQATGGGGRLYTMEFIGGGDFEGDDQTLTVATSGDATTDERRQLFAARLKIGLVHYVQDTAIADQLRISFGDAGGPAVPGVPGAPGNQAAAPEDDPWNFWVFSLSGSGSASGQATSKFSNYSGRASANRTTEAWKFSLSGNYSRFVQEFEFPRADGTVLEEKVIREDWGVSSSLVKSLGPQWALGVRADAGSSTFFNQDFRWNLRPGVEFNFFPYAESSRRSLTLQYLLGPTHFDYTEPTIFDETEETRIQQTLVARLSLVEPWGQWSTSLSGAQYLHDTSKYNVTLFGSVSIRLFRGFSVTAFGNYSWIRDQLFISGEDLSDELILLQQRQLATNYRFTTRLGIRYQFGSIFNNVVNPRFGGGGGGGFIIFG